LVVYLLIIPLLAIGILSTSLSATSAVGAQRITTSTPGTNLAIAIELDSQIVEDLNNNNLFDPGDSVRYVITYRNTSSEEISDVMMVADYDATSISSILNITSGGVVNQDTGTITWKIGTLPIDTVNTISYEARIIARFRPEGSRRIETLVTISSQTTGDISTSSAIDVRIPSLNISKSRELIKDTNKNNQPDVGDTIRYTVKVLNDGNVDAINVLIEDNYDQEQLGQPISISAEGINTGDVIKWTFDRLDKGDEITVTYETSVLTTLPLGKNSVENIVTVLCDGTMSIKVENSFDVEVLPTATSTIAPSQLPTATPEPAFIPAGPTGESISASSLAWLAIGFMLLALVGLFSLGVLVYFNKQIPSTLRDGFILSLLMGTVIILGLAGSVERSAIAGLIGTVAGYVLRSVVDRPGGNSE